MEVLALYLLKSAIWLSGFALVFILFLRNERFFILNRIYLLAGILTSFFFPLISIHYTVVVPVIKSMQIDSATVGEISNAESNIIPNLRLLLLIAYVSGVMFVLAQIIRQGRSLLKAIKKSEIITLHPVKLIRTTDYTFAFSFFSYVFVNPSVTDIETKEIMNHELVHIRQKHWLDLLLVEMLCMIQWFNPLVWIYVRFIRQNHEYLADEVALQRTSDPAIYRAALLNQIVGAPVVSLANSFNYSLNKKRFNMMKNIIKSPYRKMKVLLILPVFAIVLYSFAKPDYKYLNEKTGNSNVTLSPLQQEVKGIIVQKDGEPLPGAIVTLKGTTLGTVAGDKGSFKIGPVPDDGILIVSFVGFKSKALKPVFTSDMRIEMMRDTIKYSGMTFTTPPPPPPPPPTPVALPAVAPPPPPPPPPSDKTNKAPFVAVETLPEFPGGKDALAAWISSNLKYPGDAYKNKISGEVLVSFLVTNTGTVKDVTVIKSASPLLNEEAIRVISSMPDWKPATQHQKNVGVNMQVPVEFNLK